MYENNPIRVFVTHTFSENDDYLRVFEFLESVDRFFYLNVSKPENVPTTGGMEAIKDELIRQINGEGVTFVVITHNREIAEAFPRTIGLRDGRIEYDSGVR